MHASHSLLRWCLGGFLAVLTPAIVPARADGPADNQADRVRRIPPPGINVAPAVRTELSAEVTRLGDEIAALQRQGGDRRVDPGLLADVQIYHKAVDWALRYDEFFKTNEFRAAGQLLTEGFSRATALRNGTPYWNQATGLVVRGYVSKIDGSVQPYGLVIPATYRPGSPHRFRLDFWFHGRGETLSELAFIAERSRNPGEFTPPNTFVLHLYGRYCNGSRLAGETDFWEAFEEVRRRYPIDEDRLVVRGFSLGGAACWHMTVHHASRWAAAAPGAGFSETAEFLRVFQNETLKPAWWEQKLWRLHDATDHALNLSMVPTIAYSGAIDRQKQAADAVAAAARREGLELTHLIGTNTAHSYEARAKQELNRRIDAIAARGRDPLPRSVRFVTHTLRYPTMAWVTLDGLTEHWEPARIEADIVDARNLRITTRNVTALNLAMPPGLSPLDLFHDPVVEIDGTRVTTRRPGTDRSWNVRLQRAAGGWVASTNAPDPAVLRKRTGLQGPIDDAFMDSFVMVRPTGTPMNAKVGAWTQAEMNRALEHWRQHYRGDARVKADTDISDADIAAHNLVLWGDPESNRLLKRILPTLPLRWDAQGVHTPAALYPADRHAPVLIYPNPLNPNRYVVINSGFTFREYDYLNNARQTPKLPDWAVIDLSQPVNARAPGGIAAAGFFDEAWQWKAPRP